MSGGHKNQALTVRPGAEVKAAAQAALEEHDRRMQEFVTACLVAVAADPGRFLEMLKPHWPEPRRTGRPPAAEQGSGS